MSYSDIDKLTGPFTDPAIRSIDVSSSPLADRPLARGEHTYYGDGIIEYEYQPPKGDIQRVCGILGKDKTETIQLVKKGFPDLAMVESERFEFQVYNIRQSWVTVMEEAWELLSRDPPLVWVIKIKDTPEERAERNRQASHRSDRNLFIALFIIVTVLMFILLTGLQRPAKTRLCV